MSDAAGPPTGAGPSGGTGSTRPPWVPFAIGAVVLVALVALAFIVIGGNDDDGDVETGGGTSAVTATTVTGGTAGTAVAGTSAPSKGTTVPATGTTITTETTVPADDTGVPPTGPTTDTTVAGEPIDCGSITPSGWPTTTAPNPAVMGCLYDAFEAGTPATLLEVSYDAPDGGGDPAYRHEIRYEVIGTSLLRVTTDWATATAPDAPDTVTVQECTELAPDTMWPAPGNCTVVS